MKPSNMKALYQGIINRVVYELSFLRPKWLWIELTDLCNSRCEYCNIYKKKPTLDQISPIELGHALTNKLFSNVRYLLNSGGEPTVRSDLLELLIAEHEALPRATIQLSTNGLLPWRVIKVAEEMVSRNTDFEVGISLDGVGVEHDQIRGVKGNFEKVDGLVKALLDMHVRVGLGATLTERNLEANLHAMEYAKQKNIPFLFHWFNQSSFYDNLMEEKASLNVSQAVQRLPNNLYRNMWLRWLQGGQIDFRCFALNTFAAIKCNGDIVPCLTMWDDVVGNIRQGDPTATWGGQKARNVRKMIKRCKGCLNSWGVGWSIGSIYYPILINSLINRLRGC